VRAVTSLELAALRKCRKRNIKNVMRIGRLNRSHNTGADRKIIAFKAVLVNCESLGVTPEVTNFVEKFLSVAARLIRVLRRMAGR